MGNAVTKREEKPATPVKAMSAFVMDTAKQLADVLPKGVPVERFVRAAQTAIIKDPTGRLSGCTQESVYYSLMECARVGLMPDGRQSALIPYYNKKIQSDEAQFQPMVEGIIDLMHRSPDVWKIEARAVRKRVDGDPDTIEGDEFDYWHGPEGTVWQHRPKCPPSEKTFDPRVVGAYAVVWWSNGAPPTFEYVPRIEIEAARKMGQGETPMWKGWYGEGARKVAVKRLSKYVDLEPEAAAVIAMDHEIETGGREAKTQSAAAATERTLAEIESSAAKAARQPAPEPKPDPHPEPQPAAKAKPSPAEKPAEESTGPGLPLAGEGGKDPHWCTHPDLPPGYVLWYKGAGWYQVILLPVGAGIDLRKPPGDDQMADVHEKGKKLDDAVAVAREHYDSLREQPSEAGEGTAELDRQLQEISEAQLRGAIGRQVRRLYPEKPEDDSIVDEVRQAVIACFGEDRPSMPKEDLITLFKWVKETADQHAG